MRSPLRRSVGHGKAPIVGAGSVLTMSGWGPGMMPKMVAIVGCRTHAIVLREKAQKAQERGSKSEASRPLRDRTTR